MRVLAREPLMVDVAVGQAATVYSNVTAFDRATGDCSIFLSSTAGVITVTQQCSFNREDWYDPIDSSGNKLGEVITAQTVTTGLWISFTPVLAPYSRFKVVEANSAPTTVTLRLMYQEQPR